MTIGRRIKTTRERLGLTQEDVAKVVGVAIQTIYKYENEIVTNIPLDKLEKIAVALHTTPAYLMGWTDEIGDAPVKSNAVFLPEQKIHMVPLYESASAGFGALANGNVIDYVPLYFVHEAEAEETICIKVQGDSMYPKIEDGDVIQVHRQESVDSGSLAVVLLDNDEGLVKRVVYGSDWVELQSINPMYPPMRFEKNNVLRVRVVGAVRTIIKKV
jgi:repressor LexA